MFVPVNYNEVEKFEFYQTPKWLFDMLKNKKITPGAYMTYLIM